MGLGGRRTGPGGCEMVTNEDSGAAGMDAGMAVGQSPKTPNGRGSIGTPARYFMPSIHGGDYFLLSKGTNF